MRRILIVDDLEINLLLLEYNFKSIDDNLEITKAFDGEQALELMEKEGGYDMIIMDIVMPKMDGFEATRLIKEQWPETLIILHCCDCEKRYEKYSKFGFDDMLEKPLTREKFFAFMQKYTQNALIA